MMTKTITKLLFLTFLIQIIKSKKIILNNHNHLSNEKVYNDDSRPVSDQKSLEDLKNRNNNVIDVVDPKHNNLLEIDSKLHKNEINNTDQSQSDQDEESLSNEVYEEITSKFDHLNKDRKLNEHKTSEHNNLNNKRIDGGAHQQEEKITPENKIENRNIDKSERPTTKSNQRTSEHTKLSPSHLNKPTMVTDNNFPYMVAVMKGTTYLCAGALIDENWVLTAAGGIRLMRETIRFLRIRLGSTNYKKGGTLLAVKYLEIHPYYNSSMPAFDLALIMLSKPARYTARVRYIRLELTPKEVTTTHFIMTSWLGVVKSIANRSVETSKHQRILSVTHLHPSDPEECVEDLKEIGVEHDGVMCFNGKEDACMRDTGAPVVINGVLWSIISSWKPQGCDAEDFIFATLVSDRNISTWIHATVHGLRWHKFSI